jgi:hypothetical protein
MQSSKKDVAKMPRKSVRFGESRKRNDCMVQIFFAKYTTLHRKTLKFFSVVKIERRCHVYEFK